MAAVYFGLLGDNKYFLAKILIAEATRKSSLNLEVAGQ